MPGGDGTGPYGTFRNCTPVDGDYAGPRFGRGRGRGRGWRCWNRRAPDVGGRGRNMFYVTGEPGWARGGNPAADPQPISRNDEIAELKQELSDLTEAKDDIKKRLDELSKD